MKIFNLALSCLALLGATAGAELSGPPLVRFTPTMEPPVPSTEEGHAPLSARGRIFEFICTQSYAEDGDIRNEDDSFFDHRCTFHSMDRTELELPKDPNDESIPDDEHQMRIYTYTKTGADSAVITCRDVTVYDDGHECGSVMFEIHLQFSSAGDGSAQFVTCGHACDHYGCGIFTFRH